MEQRLNPRTKPTTLPEVQRQFEQWRRIRKRGTTIPESLWEGAVSVCADHSLHQVSRQLHLEYNQLKRRAGTFPRRHSPRPPGPQFVELATKPSLEEGEWLLEREEPDGSKRKLQIKGRLGLDPLELMKAFWGWEG